MSRQVLDSHLHVWDLARGQYAWLGPHHGELYRSFLPQEATTVLVASGISSAVLVQAEDSATDTDFLLSVAEEFPFFEAVVGWVQLDDPTAAARQLTDFRASQAFRGVRHLVHDDPRDDFLELPAVLQSLRLIADEGLAFDVPDAWPRHLGQLPGLADALPDLVVVVDHLAKPPRGSSTEDLQRWAHGLREIADRPNTVAKLSGLQVQGQPFSPDSLRPVWDCALDCFGPERLMYGGDWPMTCPAGGYELHWATVQSLVAELSTDEQAQILAGTARAAYGLRCVDADEVDLSERENRA